MGTEKSMQVKFCALLIAAFFSLFAFCSSGAFADDEFCDVYVGNDKIFAVSNTKILSAVERGQLVMDTIQGVIDDSQANLDDLNVKVGMDGVPVIYLKDKVLCSVTKADAEEYGKSQTNLAIDWCEKLRLYITRAREKEKKDAEAASSSSSSSSTPKDASASASSAEKPKKSHTSNSLSEHAVLLLFIEISLLLFTSLVCGELFVRLGQPAIIGQIFAGLLLGPTFFGALFPDLSSQLFPRDGSQSKLIEVISWIGVSFLLMLTGMETDIAMLKRLGKPLLCFGVIGLLGPLLVGAGMSMLLSSNLLGEAQNKLAFAVFLGTVFAASSVPVVAKVLMDMKMLKLSVGQLIIATSLAHDLLCCLLLAVIVVLSGSAGEAGNPVLVAIFGTMAFLAVMYFGRPVFFTVLRWVNDHVSNSDGLITGMVVLLLACAATTQALGVHIVLGAFAAGVILSQTPVVNHKVVRPLEIVTMAFFAPVFFASSGLNVNLSSLLEPKLCAITALLSLATIVVKLTSCVGAGRIAGYGIWESLAVGVGANTKGSLGLILAMLGLSLEIISQDMYAVIIFIALFSTGVSAPLMKFTMGRVKITDEEINKMKREERRSRTILSSIRRVLWPTSGRGRNAFIAKLLNSIGQSQVVETTALWVKQPNGSSEKPFASLKDAVDRKFVSVFESTVVSADPMKVISEEGNRGYDLIVMATDEPPGDAQYVFGELVDGVILNTSTRALVIYEPNPNMQREIQEVLIPVSGNEQSIAAAEFGISLAKSLNAKVFCLCIQESEANDLYSEATQSGKQIERNVSNEITNTLKELADALDVEFKSILVQTSAHPAQAAILTAQQHDIDLIVLGAEPKIGKGLFIGHTINYVLRHPPCAVAVLKIQG
ncbi:MAG TPA: cation:proton antiporter [Candidatus Melainabacteria bacterium]|nr:cation:proton antiporter [Candidatus Melainabacteria bacterium]